MSDQEEFPTPRVGTDEVAINAWKLRWVFYDEDGKPAASMAARAAAAPAQPVAEVYRGHYGGRSRNIGFDTVRALLPQEKMPPPGTKLYAAAPAQAAPASQEEYQQWRADGSPVPAQPAVHIAGFGTQPPRQEYSLHQRELMAPAPQQWTDEQIDDQLFALGKEWAAMNLPPQGVPDWINDRANAYRAGARKGMKIARAIAAEQGEQQP